MNNTAFSTFSSHFKFTPHSPYTVYSAESSLQPTNRLYRGMWCEWTVTRTGKQEWSRTYSISLLMLLVIASSWLMGLGWLLTPMIVESADILVSGVYFWKKKKPLCLCFNTIPSIATILNILFVVSGRWNISNKHHILSLSSMIQFSVKTWLSRVCNNSLCKHIATNATPGPILTCDKWLVSVLCPWEWKTFSM